MNITDPIRHRARVSPRAVAIVRADDSSVSYEELDQIIDAAAARVDGTGLAAGQVAGLAIGGADEFPPLVLALALARAGIASAEPSLPAQHLDAVFTPGGISATTFPRAIGFDESWSRPSRGTPATRPMHPGGAAICRIFASSGTAGTPKFAAISHDLIARRIFSNMLGMGAPERVHICAVGFGITFGFCGVLRMLWTGGTLVLTNPADCFDAIQRHQVSSMQIATGSLARLVESLPDDATPPPSLRLLETGGSLTPPRLLELTRRKLCANVQSYFGATETGGVASAMFSTLEGIDGAVGHIHPGFEAQAVDPQDRPLPPSAEGRIRLRGANIIDGYFGEATPTASVFRDGWFYPGDIGSITASGVMTINGRESEFINAGGVKINPRVVEDVLLALPDVTDAAAFGVPDRMGVTRVWAAIVAPAVVPRGVLNDACRQHLGVDAPKFVLQMKGLPRNANGKVARDELMAFAMSQQP